MSVHVAGGVDIADRIDYTLRHLAAARTVQISKLEALLSTVQGRKILAALQAVFEGEWHLCSTASGWAKSMMKFSPLVERIAGELVRCVRVSVIDGAAFGAATGDFMRLCFATDEIALHEAVRRIRRFVGTSGT